ncbi:MAG: purine-nucleoside phosphorylase [Bacteroidetes bacterium]|nr:purine-nucleoside phosphorylase [Bacteroidota bacterium]
MVDLEFKYKNLIEKIQEEAPFKPEIALVLGSGLGEFADRIDTIKSIATHDLPDYPESTVQGHKGFIHFAEHGGKKLVIFQGRLHYYEGYSISECILPPFIAKSLGCDTIILTNAAGGINPNLRVADLMVVNSFFTMHIQKALTELMGVASVDQKNAFLDVPALVLGHKFVQAGLDEGIALKEGTYWFQTGPSYETPSEINMLAKLGADAVGMSTVHEAVYAGINGMKVGIISCITNAAAGMGHEKLSHKDVMETAELVKTKFERLMKRIVEII